VADGYTPPDDAAERSDLRDSVRRSERRFHDQVSRYAVEIRAIEISVQVSLKHVSFNTA
jgi:hypothetical protein